MDNNINYKDNILFASQFKKALLNELIYNFNLYKVEPFYVSKFEGINYNRRTINFDNCLANENYCIDNIMDLKLLRYFYYLHIEVYSGIICDYYHFNRDFIIDSLNGPSFNYLSIEYKIRYEEINKEYLNKLINEIFKIINKNILLFKINNDVNIFINNIENILVNKLKKQYPLLNLEDSLNEYMQTKLCCLFFNDNNRISELTKSNFDLYAQVFVLNSQIHKIVKIAETYIISDNLTLGEYQTNSHLTNNDNIFVLNLNLSLLIMYVLKLNDIKELMDI